MPLDPVVANARPRTEYAEVRVSSFAAVQDAAGGPLRATFEIRRGRTLPGGAFEDAPLDVPGASAILNVRLTLAEIVTHPVLGPVLFGINAYAPMEALRQGVVSGSLP